MTVYNNLFLNVGIKNKKLDEIKFTTKLLETGVAESTRKHNKYKTKCHGETTAFPPNLCVSVFL